MTNLIQRHKTRAVLLAALLLLCCGTAVPAQPAAGQNKKPARVVVVEFFWYGCPHCYAFEPYLQKWLKTKPDYIKFVRVPGILKSQWVPFAKAYFTAEKLGVVDRIHERLFDAIHKQKRKFPDDNAIRDFFVEQGVDGKEFSRIYHSREISDMVRQAYETQREFRIASVPTLIINDKYRLNLAVAHSFPNMLKLVDRLARRESGVAGAAH